MDIISGINVTASALDAEKTRMDVVAQNIANAHTTRGPDGQPYQRKVVSFESFLDPATRTTGARIGRISDDPAPGETVHQPGHPDADADGYVRMPNVNLAFEMVDLMNASRAYEANLSVIRNARQMAVKALSIGR